MSEDHGGADEAQTEDTTEDTTLSVATNQKKSKNFMLEVEESRWLTQVQTIIRIAGCVVDLIDVQGCSVLVGMEDGWDFTAQVVSIAQIMLDPFYRTLAGFKILVEKEWQS